MSSVFNVRAFVFKYFDKGVLSVDFYEVRIEFYYVASVFTFVWICAPSSLYSFVVSNFGG